MPVNCRNCVLRIAVAVEPTLEGNVDNRSRKFQQLLCPFYPLGDRVFVGGCADPLLKQMAEMKLTHAQQLS